MFTLSRFSAFDNFKLVNFLTDFLLFFSGFLRNRLQQNDFDQILDPIFNKLLYIQPKEGGGESDNHPKIYALKNIILEIIETDDNSKILILFSRHFESIAPEVKYILEKDLLVGYYPTNDFGEEEYKKVFLSSNVVLGQETNYLFSCPWKVFSHVIHYESNYETNWHKIACSNNPRLKFTLLNSVFNKNYDSTIKGIYIAIIYIFFLF